LYISILGWRKIAYALFDTRLSDGGPFCACRRRGGRSYAQKEQAAPCRKIVLKLPHLDHAKSEVLNSRSSPYSKKNSLSGGGSA
jgi:hypothetical protein